MCLFIVLISVFTWVMHRRLTQYEQSPSAGGHHMTAIKVSLTERPQISVPSVDALDGMAVFLTVLSFALAWFHAEDLSQIQAFRVLSHRQPRIPIRTLVVYFSSLPPPEPSSALL